MAATWTVVDMDRDVSVDSKEDVVRTLHWTCTDNDGDHAGSAYGSVVLDTSDLSSFIAFADVTADKAVEWLKAALGEEKVKLNEDIVASQIKSSKTPETKTGVPW
jgi:hypothetical protein|tara:strand:+ start:601 stop:915 length:315 start_codon:yes stop_codon:yes gene_type:complete